LYQSLIEISRLICLLGLGDGCAQAKGRRPPQNYFQFHIFSPAQTPRTKHARQFKTELQTVNSISRS
jgi:hypothetical protein